ncbi:MAG: DNA polymerase III subunit alpha [Acidobacteria bacterium]|nr:DNA polymerase III subunit alpha [Acidobacteriota bacterium]
MSGKFVHLHLHTDYSLLDGACKIDQLLDLAVQREMHALAMTDHGNLFGAVEFYNAATKRGIQPLLGCEIYVARDSRHKKSGGSDNSNHLILLVETQEGYRNLIQLVSKGYLEGFYYKPRIDKELLSAHSRGLMALSACLKGAVCSNLLKDDLPGAEAAACELREILGRDNFFLEIQDHGLDAQKKTHPGLREISRRTGIPLVATNDVHYLTAEDAPAHDVLLCIQTGKTVEDPNRMRYPGGQFYFKTDNEMAAVFREIPGAVERTAEIASRCHFEIDKSRLHLPQFDVPAGHTADSYFEKIVREGFEERALQLKRLASQNRLGQPLEAYRARLEQEIAIIKETQFSSYFLIVWDFIRYAQERAIPVGPGRGSAAGSLVSYCLRITDIDPLRYGLLFERFLNPERITPPDIDIDFCMNRRGEVIEYVTRKYGRENVCQIITFGTMAARGVIRDAGRGLNIPYNEVDRIAKLIPNTLDATIDKALATVPQLQEARQDPKVDQLLQVAKKLEGLARHASTHAAGVVIAPRPLMELVPLYQTNKDEITTQYAMTDLEEIGLLKMDFLGLATLTVIEEAVRQIREQLATAIDLENLPLDDPETYRLFSEGRTTGVFQFESSGMREILRKFKPTKFEELIALNALYRPGPIQGGMIEEFIQRKHGEIQVSYELPELQEILAETYGVIVYQEQVMQIASKLGDFTLGEADLLRRAMGKKKPEVMQAQREKFLAGARKNRIPEKKAKRIFDLMERFAGYGFNKSHSTAYALISFQTAYLKTHYPVPFMAALLTCEMDKPDKMVRHLSECKEMGIPILPPDINDGSLHFQAAGSAVRFGLAAIKNVGEAAIKSVLASRQEVGRFDSLFQFCEKVDLRLVNKRVLESLIKAGAFDSLGYRRAQLFAVIDKAMEHGQKAQRDRLTGQQGLFGTTAFPAPSAREELPDVEDWTEFQRLAHERETVGFYVTGHPLHPHLDTIRQLGAERLDDLGEKQSGSEVTVAGLVTASRRLRTKRGDQMAVFTLEDLAGTAEVVVFPTVFEKCWQALKANAPVLVKGRCEVEEDARIRLLASDVIPLGEARSLPPQHLLVRVDLNLTSRETASALYDLLRNYPGATGVRFELRQPDGSWIRLEPTPPLKVGYGPDLLAAIEGLSSGLSVIVSSPEAQDVPF